jgi:hypothetical protein
MAWLHFTNEIDLTGAGTVVLAVATAVRGPHARVYSTG